MLTAITQIMAIELWIKARHGTRKMPIALAVKARRSTMGAAHEKKCCNPPACLLTTGSVAGHAAPGPRHISGVNSTCRRATPYRHNTARLFQLMAPWSCLGALRTTRSGLFHPATSCDIGFLTTSPPDPRAHAKDSPRTSSRRGLQLASPSNVGTLNDTLNAIAHARCA